MSDFERLSLFITYHHPDRATFDCDFVVLRKALSVLWITFVSEQLRLEYIH